MGMPSIGIFFTELAATAIQRGDRGIIAMILKESSLGLLKNPIVCASAEDVPSSLKEENQEQINLALMGYVNTPKKIIAYVIQDSVENYNDALDYLKTVKFDYLVVPTVETDEQTAAIVSYVKSQRAEDKLIKAVLPNVAGDNEGIINYATEEVMVGDKKYTTEQYCARIAGIIAGTPLSISCTYAPLSELTDCRRHTKEEMDASEEAGKFIVWWDSEKVKTGRGVNSLTTMTEKKNKQFRKIKVVDIMDLIANDLRMAIEDQYIGKMPNTYDNKCLLVSGIGNYFERLNRENIIGSYEIGIDVSANRSYLKENGKDVGSMSDTDIKTANTGSYVFLTCKLSILDAIEDVVLPITI